jgi:uncharacterized membrane protein YkvA (DUF1232 family)
MPARTRSPRRSARRRETVTGLRPRDFRSYLLTHASQIAPADVRALVARSASIRAMAREDGGRHPRLRRQVEVGLALLADHVADRCPQIPYRAVSLVAAALFYYVEPVDVVPDVIPGAGSSDDALMLELACREAGAGLTRYLDWKDLSLDGPPATARPGRSTLREAPSSPPPTQDEDGHPVDVPRPRPSHVVPASKTRERRRRRSGA